ncbi:MAG: polyphosphate polymerase domain-containing protein [bacterium]|nr:polyphosphate polymerase domain-containing protein [bacterium]
MYGATTDSDLTMFSRFECKYIVSPMVLPTMREFIEPHMQPDPYAARCPGYRYVINSLYLDSDDLKLYNQTVGGDKDRFKLRIRTYSDEVDSPVFLEVKTKRNSTIRKRRGRIHRSWLAPLLRTRPVPEMSDDVRRDADFFFDHGRWIEAKPVMRVRFTREAYESKAGEPLRVTFDTDLMHAVTLNYDLSLETGRWVTTPLPGTILEIKFTERFAPWVHDLVRIFGLRQQPVPKYGLSVEHMMYDGREAALAVAGFTLPPRRA